MINYSKLKLVTIEESTDNPNWKTSRDCAKKIADVIQKLDVMFTLDNFTVADGNCFSFAIHQQLRRSDVIQSLNENLKEIVNRMDASHLSRRCSSLQGTHQKSWRKEI